MKKSKKPKLPPGWDEASLRELIEHYDSLTDVQWAAQIEAAFDSDETSLVAVPNELVPDVVRLIARKHKAKTAPAKRR